MGAGSVRVVVVTYWPGDVLAAFLDSLVDATKHPLDVVIADNGSGDGVPEREAAARDGVTLVPTGGNIGYGAAANVGAAARVDRAAGGPSRGAAGAPSAAAAGAPSAGAAAGGGAREAGGRGPGEWVVVANPDITWRPGSLDELLAATERWPRAAAFGPAILTPQGDLYPSARDFPTLSRGIGHALLGWWWPTNPWTRSYRRESGGPVEAPAEWISGSCMLLRREAFDAVGGFDPGYFMYFEDLDLCRRLAGAGWQSVYVPTAVVEHTGAHSTKRSRKTMLRAHHRSAYRYLAGQYRGARWAPVRLLLALGLAARYVASLVVRGVGEGAKPTRGGDVLKEG